MTPEAHNLYKIIICESDEKEREAYLDKLVPLLIREGMERAAIIVDKKIRPCGVAVAIRQAAKEVK